MVRAAAPPKTAVSAAARPMARTGLRSPGYLLLQELLRLDAGQETNLPIREIINPANDLHLPALRETREQGLRSFEPFHVKRNIFGDRGREKIVWRLRFRGFDRGFDRLNETGQMSRQPGIVLDPFDPGTHRPAVRMSTPRGSPPAPN